MNPATLNLVGQFLQIARLKTLEQPVFDVDARNAQLCCHVGSRVDAFLFGLAGAEEVMERECLEIDGVHES